MVGARSCAGLASAPDCRGGRAGAGVAAGTTGPAGRSAGFAGSPALEPRDGATLQGRFSPAKCLARGGRALRSCEAGRSITVIPRAIRTGQGCDRGGSATGACPAVVGCPAPDATERNYTQ